MSGKLVTTSEGLTLELSEFPQWLPFKIDFCHGPMAYRARHIQGRNELIAKAVGWRKDQAITIFDTTAGLGREAFLLAHIGCHVTLFERHQTVAALLQDALTRAQADPDFHTTAQRMQFISGCAIQYLSSAQCTQKPDVIYCDPMFEDEDKSALVKKEMQVLQHLVGPDPDATELVQVALKHALKRVVVKRALYAPTLVVSPTHVFRAKSHRFDVYCIINT